MNSNSEFLALFLRHQADLRAFLGSLIREPNDFDDVFQETVLTLWAKFDTYDRERSFGAWARGIAANKILQFQSRYSRMPIAFSPEAIAAIVDAFEHQPLSASVAGEALEKCLEQLPDNARRALQSWYAEARSIQRVADYLGTSTTAAYKSLQRMRTRLLECIERRLATGQEGRS